MDGLGSGVTQQPRRWLAGLALVVGVLLGGGLIGHHAPASAQTDTADQAIRGNVRNQYEQDGERIQEGVPEVRIVVETEDGQLVAEATTDADGQYFIPIDEPGTYVVRLDQATLPEGLSIAEGKDTFTVNLTAHNTQTRAFFLGEDLRVVKGKWAQLPQVLANGLKLATVIAITSIGLSLIFGTTGLSNFAHGELVTLGAVIAWGFNRAWASWSLVAAAAAAFVLSGIAGGAADLALWRPLRRRGTSLTSMMIVSIGLALAVRHLFLFFMGGDLKQYSQFTLQPDQVSIGPLDLAPRSLWIMGLSLAMILGVAFFLLRTRFGKAIRAVADNPSLASSSGIDSERVVLVVWMLGGALAGIGGVFYGLEFGVKWDMGFTLLLLMFAAITLGGLGNPFGALVGSLIIGVMVELWTWVIPNANDLKNVGALIALIVLLLIRPQGLLGSRERVG
jgi:branched-chain amino acid transport system permease protein